MLTNVVSLSCHRDRLHQAWEYVDILGLSAGCEKILDPKLSIPSDMMDEARVTIGKMRCSRCIGMMPGAAYGPAKRWPAEYFAEVGRMLAESGDFGVAVMGSRVEADLCATISSAIGAKALNLAGQTSLPQLAAMLCACGAVLTNDSGGMHLAAAVGVPVVAVYGITDYSKTGPLGSKARVIAGEGVSRSRDIERSSAEAESSLRSIMPERVYKALVEFLDVRP